jgi:copper homeostasis protein
MSRPYTLEVVVDSCEAAIVAEKAGAHRLELCSGLELGGLSPGIGLVQRVLRAVTIPVHVLIRPRAGDFIYSDDEFDTIVLEARHALDSGASGLVVGFLTEDAKIDLERTQRFCSQVGCSPVTFHRAFDHADNTLLAMETLRQSGARRLLTSGGAPAAEEGLHIISQLVKIAHDGFSVMPGGGITPKNVVKIARESGASEFHFSGIKKMNSKTKAGAGIDSLPYTIVPDPQKIELINAELRTFFETMAD